MPRHRLRPISPCSLPSSPLQLPLQLLNVGAPFPLQGAVIGPAPLSCRETATSRVKSEPCTPMKLGSAARAELSLIVGAGGQAGVQGVGPGQSRRPPALACRRAL